MKKILFAAMLLIGYGFGCDSTDPLGDLGDSGNPASSEDDGPDFVNDFPVEHSLTGKWEDAGREVTIMQVGNQVTSLFLKDFECDDGTGTITTTDFNFDATLMGDSLIGETHCCYWGFDDPGQNGLNVAPFEATVNADGTEIKGTWYNAADERDDPIVLTRLGCLEKTAEDYGLPAGNGVNSAYNANRVYRKDGSVETVADNYVLNPETDTEVRRHRGVDYSSMDAAGNITNVEFSAGVTGTASIVAGSAWNTINVTLANGNVVQYLHASEISITNGQAVTPGTVLGKTGNTGASAIHLHVQAKDPAGNYINPSCAEDGISE